MRVVTPITYGKLAALRIDAPDGASAVVSLYGAHLLSWADASGCERLFLSDRSALDGSGPIRGGVPVIFPQFAQRGSGMRHGFARVSTWRLDGSGMDGAAAWAAFALDEADLAPAIARAWPQRFTLTLRVALHADTLEIGFGVSNRGEAPFAFSSALHSYWRVDDIARARIDGVREAALAIDGKHDHIYRGVGGEIVLRSGAGTLRLAQDGFIDAVVWNPGAADAAALSDLEDDDYLGFVCIEAALIEPASLAAGATWRGRQRIRAA